MEMNDTGHTSRKSGSGCLIAVAVVVVLAGVAGFFAVRQLNTFVSNVADTQLQQMLEQTDFASQVSFSSVQVNTVTGRVSIYDLSYVSPNPHTRAGAEKLELDMSYGDLLRLARRQERTRLNGVGISVSGGSLTDTRRDTSVGMHDLNLHISGELLLGEVEELYLTEVDLRADGFTFSDAAAGVSAIFDSLEYSLTGDIALGHLDGGPDQVIHQLDAMKLSLSGSEITLSDEITAELAAVFGEAAWIAQHPGWRVEHTELSVLITENQLSVEQFMLDSPLVELDGSLDIQLNSEQEPESIHGELLVSELAEDLRGEDLPSEGSFTIAFGIDFETEPYFEIR